MSTSSEISEAICENLAAFATRHRLIVANDACLSRHAERFVELGHCPCVAERLECPCPEALSDIERIGRCECGILIDPARIFMQKTESDST